MQNAGAIPDPNFGDRINCTFRIPIFYSDFWYRTEFTAPSKSPQQFAWLNFDGINWKAEVFLNGEKLGRIEGGFMRGQFDVSQKILPGRVNALAVRIEKNATPGSAKQKTFEVCAKNGGGLGADNPTYHSSIGWDWIPTMRGRDIGIWGDVFLTVSGSGHDRKSIRFCQVPASGKTSADVTFKRTLVNHQAHPFTGPLRCQIGDIRVQQPVQLAAGETRRPSA